MEKEKEKKKKVQSIREMITMRFRISHENAKKLRKGKNNYISNFIDRIRGKIHSSQIDEQINSIFCLKFIEKLNEECLLIGNQYQLTSVSIHCLSDFTQTNSYWSIAQETLITNFFVTPKVRSLFIVCSDKLHLYSYCLESAEQTPIKQQTFTFSENIFGVYLIKRSIIFVLLKTKFDVFQIEYAYGKSRMSLKKSYPYFEGKNGTIGIENLQLISIPEDQGSTFQIFFKQVQKKALYQIFSIKIQCISIDQIHINPLHKFCQVPERYIKSLQISHYRSDIYLVYVGLQLYAVRNNYFLDNIITNTSKLRSFIKEFANNYFFLYHKQAFELYRYQLNEKLTPQRFQVQCLDTIPINKPDNSFFFDIKQLGDNLIFIFQQPKPYNSSQLIYWLSISSSIDIDKKIDTIYPSSCEQIEQFNKQDKQQKIKMALQIGYKIDEAYLQLWNRSSKSTNKDYNLLIETENYQMIANQIEIKFKKASLKYLQVKNLMFKSLLMLRQKIKKGSQNSQKIKQFVCCHFLYCKYLMFQKIKLEQSPKLKVEQLIINIQDYYQLTGIEIVKYFFQLLSVYISDGNKSSTLIQIRALITQFSLIFRIKYHLMLPSITKNFTKDLLLLLRNIPELLPIIQTNQKKSITSGFWITHDLKNTEEYIILQNFTNFQNKKNIQEFIESKFFKVYQWHSHGAFSQSKLVLLQKQKQFSEQFFFILFYEQLLLNKKNMKYEDLNKIIDFIELSYPKLPLHLRGKFRFYEALYDIFFRYHQIQKKKFMKTLEFLKLGQDELFQIYFQEERAKKGIFLLKEVQPIYERTVQNGKQLFLKSMFRFFQGTRSNWADLKIILNKFNNQKEDFHKYNCEVFQAIVKAIFEKVRVGSENSQTDLGEVISYLQNIPFPLQQSSLLQGLISIQQIHGEQQTLKHIKINMNLRQILQNGQQVIYRMIESQINKYKVYQVTDINELKLFAYKILTEVNYRKSNIYLDKHINFPFKCFLMILMQNEKQISACRKLLKDQFLIKTFKINEKLIENIVIFLYRKRLSINPVYEENKAYIDAIVNILQEKNVKRRFLQLSEIYAEMFSAMRYKIKYPFFKTYYPTVDEVARVIQDLDREELMNIDYQELFQLIIQLKSLGEEQENISDTKNNYFSLHLGQEKLQIMKHELYTIFFMNYMKQGLIKEKGLKIASQIMQMNTKYVLYNIIVPIFLIQVAQKQIINQVVEPLFSLISYYFNSQEELQRFVNWIFTRKQGFTNSQLIREFQLMKKLKLNVPIFDPNNPLFTTSFKKQLKKYNPSQQAFKFNPIFEDIWHHIVQTREQFSRQKSYSILFRLLLHSPYVLAEYINRKQGGINVCSFRALLTLIGVQCIFDLKKLLQLGQGIFSILMVQLKSKIVIEDILQIYSHGQKYKDEIKQTNEYMSQLIKFQAEDLIGNSILSFRSKLSFLTKMDLGQIEAEKQRNFQLLMQKKQQYFATHLNYPFDDKDRLYALPQYNLEIKRKSRNNQKLLQFQESEQRSQLVEHLNYFIKPIFKSQGNEDFIHFRESKRAKRKPLLKFRSLVTNSEILQGKQDAVDFPVTLKIIQQNEQREMVDLPKSFSLKEFQSLEIEQAQFTFQNGFVDFMQNCKEEQLEQNQSISSDLLWQIDYCLENKPQFNSKLLQEYNTQQQKRAIFEQIVVNIYGRVNSPLSKRIPLIWKIKKILFGQFSKDRSIEKITMRLSQCQLVSHLSYKIQDVFTPVIFTQQFTTQGLVQLVRQNLIESISHQQDILKSADIIEHIFQSHEIKQSILMIFLIKLCRSFDQEQDERQRNHLKDQIILIQQNINERLISQAIQTYSKSHNKDLKKTSKVLQSFKKYRHHLNSTSHHLSELLQQ